jgi:glucose/arabinose dehydrogenase
MIKNFTSELGRCAFLLLCVLSIESNAQIPTIVFQPVINGLSSPVDIVNAGDGSNRIFIVLQGGTIRVYDQSYNFLGTFLTVTGIVSGGEQGLLSLAFHPNYTTNGFLYVYYTSSPNGDVTIARYTRSAANPNQADPASRVVLLSVPKPTDGSGVPFTNHNGGKLNFGPEGYLYFGLGDGGSGNDPFNNAQDGTTLRGKMLRLNVNNPDPPFYFIPPDNPYVSDPNVRDEIWVLGLRNPWRWSFDRLTHDMWIGDVGQSAREEVDFRTAGNTGGINYGWRCFEGMIPTPGVPPCTPTNYVPPIFDYTHDPTTGGIAITGGYVYRGSEFPTLYGYYVTADYNSGNLWLLHSDGSSHRQPGLPTSITSFGEAEDGTLLATAGSSISKVAVVAEAPTPVKLISFTLRQDQNFNDLYWTTGVEINTKEFVIQYSSDGFNFTDLTKVPSSQNQSGASYSYRHYTINDKKIFYRLKNVDNDGHAEYSKIISTSVSKSDAQFVSVYAQPGHTLVVQVGSGIRSFRIVNAYGQIIYKQPVAQGAGWYYVDNKGWSKGMYVLVAEGDQAMSRKFIIQ